MRIALQTTTDVESKIYAQSMKRVCVYVCVRITLFDRVYLCVCAPAWYREYGRRKGL